MREKLADLEKKYSEVQNNNHLLKGQLDELFVLYNLTKILSRSFELNQVVTEIFALFQDTLPIQYASLHLIDSVRQDLALMEEYGFVPGKNEALLYPNDALRDELMTQKQIVVKNMLSADDLAGHPDSDKLAFPIQYLGLPILVRQKQAIGVIHLFRSEGEFLPEEVAFLDRVSQEVNHILDKMMLFSQTRERSYRDELTGAYNRRFLNRQIQAEIKRAERHRRELSLLMIDIDEFKSINDRFGHPQGDKNLQQLAQIIQTNLRKSDILTRYGGEEFVVLLPETSMENAFTVAEKLRREAERQLTALSSDRQVSITISIGVANYPSDANLADEMIDVADRRLYQAKKMGKNRTVIRIGGE